jgi:hypothetical protein
MPETPDDVPAWSWSKWYRAAREEAAFRYGLRRIPVDAYKTQYALGSSVQEGVRNIAKQMNFPVGR